MSEKMSYGELFDVIVDALDRNLCGVYGSDVMEKYFPEFDFEDYSSSGECLIALAEMGVKAVEDGVVTLEELLDNGL